MIDRCRRRAVATGSVAAALLAAVYLLAVWTTAGQRFEDAVLDAAAASGGDRASRLLDTVTLLSVLLALALVVTVGLARHRPFLSLVAAAVIVLSALTAELLQRSVLRPVLLDSGYRREDQSFPSGHTALAVSAMCALALVAPYRLRGPVVLLGVDLGVGAGVATVAAGWHRPSDTVGSDLVVVVVVCAAVAVLAWRGDLRPAAPRTPAGRVVSRLTVGVLVVAAVAAATTAAVSGRALSTGRAIALLGGACVALTLLTLLRGVDLGARRTAPSDRTGRW